MTYTLKLMNRKGKDGRWGRCPGCGQFVGVTPDSRHHQHGKGNARGLHSRASEPLRQPPQPAFLEG